MATYIPNLTDTGLDTPLYQPDFNFINQMLQRRTAMYEQGFGQVQSVYNTIRNAQLTDTGNIATRDQYLKEAQEKLRTLSSVDLSLPQNVEAATNVFSPFWQDQALLMDQSMTSSAQKEIQKALAARDSSDEKIRATYSPISLQYINNGLDALRNANRDLTKYNQAEVRQFVPFVDGIKTWEDAFAKFAKDGTDYQYVDGEYRVTESGGARLEAQLKVLAAGATTQQMKDMYKVIGITNYENRIKDFKARNPTIPVEQIKTSFAKEFLEDHKSNIKADITKTDITATAYQKELADLMLHIKNTSGYATPEQARRITSLKDTVTKLNAYKTAQSDIYSRLTTDTSPEAADILTTITSKGAAYFSQKALSTDIDNWAKGKSAITSRKVDENPVWKTKLEDADRQADNVRADNEFALTVRKQDFDEAQTIWERTNAKPGTKATGNEGSFDPQTGEFISSPTANTGQYVGPGTTLINAEPDLQKVWGEELQKKYQSYSSVYMDTTQGVADIIAEQMNDREAVVTYFSAIKANKGYSKMTAEEKEATKKVVKFLENQEGVTSKITGPGSLLNVLGQYATGYFKTKTKNGTLGAKDLQRFSLFNQAEMDKNDFIAAKEEQNRLLSQIVTNNKDPKMAKAIVTDSNGQRRLITDKDMAKDMPSLVLMINGEKTVLNSNQVADLYANNKIKEGTQQGQLIVNGKPYFIQDIGNIGKYKTDVWYRDDATSNYNEYMRSVVIPKYGTPKEISTALSTITKKATPDVKRLRDETYTVGQEFFYPINDKIDKGAPETGVLAANELANPANRNEVYLDGKLASVKQQEALAQLLSQGEAEMGKVFSGINYNTLGRVRFSIPATVNENIKLDDTSLKDIKSIEVVVNPNSNTPALNRLNVQSVITPFDKLKYGKTIIASEMEKTLGMDYSLTPNDRTNPTQVVFTRNYQFYNPKTGLMEAMPFAEPIVFPLVGPSAKSPAEIQSIVEQDKFKFQNGSRQLMAAEEAKKAADKKTGVVPQGMIPYSELEKIVNQ